LILALGAIACHSGKTDLNTNVTPALRDIPLRVLDDFFKRGAARVRVLVGGIEGAFTEAFPG
jgi:hypothetical protein